MRGVDRYFNVHRGTYRVVDAKGTSEWSSDEEKGPHLRLTEKVPKAEVGRFLDELMCRPPKAGQAGGRRK